MITRKQIIEEARSYIGTPFHHQGRIKGKGIDCAGLIVGVGKNLGLTEFDTLGYSRIPNGGQLKKILEENMCHGKIEPGNVILMCFVQEPQHLGIVSELPDGSLGIVHAYLQVRKCVEHRLDSVWRDRIIGSYSYIGVEG